MKIEAVTGNEDSNPDYCNDMLNQAFAVRESFRAGRGLGIQLELTAAH